jgi:hypothetical protein
MDFPGCRLGRRVHFAQAESSDPAVIGWDLAILAEQLDKVSHLAQP